MAVEPAFKVIVFFTTARSAQFYADLTRAAGVPVRSRFLGGGGLGAGREAGRAGEGEGWRGGGSGKISEEGGERGRDLEGERFREARGV